MIALKGSFLWSDTNIQSVYAITGAIENILTGRPIQIPDKIDMKHSISLSGEQLQPLEGNYVYKGPTTLKMQIIRRNNCLFAKLNEQVQVQVYPESTDSFFYTEIEAKIRFVKDTDGKVTKLILYQNGGETSMSRD